MITANNAVNTGVLREHHHAADYYYHRGTSDKTKNYEDIGYGYYNSRYYTYKKIKHDRCGSCRYKDYGNGYYDNYNHRGDYSCYEDYNNYGYDGDYYSYGDCGYNQYKYGLIDVNEDVKAEDDETVITNNTHKEYFLTKAMKRKWIQRETIKISWDPIGTQHLTMTMMKIGTRTCHSM